MTGLYKLCLTCRIAWLRFLAMGKASFLVLMQHMACVPTASEIVCDITINTVCMNLHNVMTGSWVTINNAQDYIDTNF